MIPSESKRVSAPIYAAAFGFGLFLCLIVVQAYFYYGQKNRMHEVGALVAYSENIIDRTNKILMRVNGGLHRAEMPQPEEIDAAFADLRAQIVDDPEQMENVAAFEAISKQNLDNLAEEVRRSTDSLAYERLDSQGQARRSFMMFGPLMAADTILGHERKSLRQNRPASRQEEARLVNVLVIAVCVTYAVLLSAIIAALMGLCRIRTAEHKLRSKDMDFRAAAEGSAHGFFLFRTDARNESAFVLEYCNPAAQAIWRGISPLREGMRIESVFPYVDESDEKIRQHFLELFLSDAGEEVEYALDGSSGTERYLLHQVTRLPNGFAVTCRDISERKQIERMKNEFISIVSHELRTPLTSIRGSLGLIMGGVAGGLSSEARNLLSIAYNNCERLVRLINDILDVEKIESGRMVFDYRPVSAAEAIRQAVEANAAYAERHGVGTVIEENEGLESSRVLADSDRMMQVLTNLLSNAVKFSPPGGVVTLRARAEDAAVRFEVSDQGPGIAEEFRSRVFEKFSQADGSDSRQKGGTGLGLSIVKAIVEEMGGQVGFTTAPGAGTTFYFTLPKTEEKNLVSLPQAKEGASRILICEDDADIAHLLRMIFERLGLESDLAASAAEAEELLKRRNYLAMTLDLQLPDKDGIRFIRDLRNDEARRDLPIVVISVKAEEGRRQIAGEAFGIVDWLTKPIDVDRLAKIVGHLRSRDTKPRILHVEDDPDILEVLRLSLSPVAEVTAVCRLSEARECIAREDYDLVILDVGLPDGAGTDLLPLLGSRARRPVPVVLFTASDVAADISHQVKAALVKSRTSERELIRTIMGIIGQDTDAETDKEVAA